MQMFLKYLNCDALSIISVSDSPFQEAGGKRIILTRSGGGKRIMLTRFRGSWLGPAGNSNDTLLELLSDLRISKFDHK